MRRQEARDLARSLMDASGLFDWRFRFDHARRRAGVCTHATRTISLSGPLTDLYDADTVRAVILHEIAHALVGPAHGHDAAWRRAARSLGAPDSARLPSSLPTPDAPWVGTCPRCGATRRLYRAPGGCPPAGSARAALTSLGYSPGAGTGLPPRPAAPTSTNSHRFARGGEGQAEQPRTPARGEHGPTRGRYP